MTTQCANVAHATALLQRVSATADAPTKISDAASAERSLQL